ncbi:proteasome regulatory particle lid subunit [Martiniozyma asiatica (nom. inval.)]|nr:proteasome regulatory particle lid subunit [Martiniozyma asiatica]
MATIESPPVDIGLQLTNAVGLVQLSATSFDPRYVLRAFRELSALRRSISKGDLVALIKKIYPAEYPTVKNLLAVLSTEDSMEVDTESQADVAADLEAIEEIDLFIHLLVQFNIHDSGDVKALCAFNSTLIPLLKCYNKRGLDHIQSKVWYYIFRGCELSGDVTSIRSDLMSALRTATLRHDDETRGMIITLLLRSYMLNNEINLAYNFVEKTEFPEVTGSVGARYFYYLARIHTIQLDYSTGNEFAITALRKCPQGDSALGFLQCVTKLHIIIQLLMGEIPELAIFKDSKFEACLRPYAAVTKAVRLGDLTLFNSALEKYSSFLKKDNNYNLVLRLRQNVIKTGIRLISLAYKRISLKDICIKLHLENELSAEYIVAKAINDGVVDATIDHTKGYMQSNELVDVYGTTGPQSEFDRRIKFCMTLHNESVKAMRYPINKGRVDEKNESEARSKEQELIAYLQEDDF